MLNVKLGCALALEGKQLVSVVLILLAACRDFGRETRLKRSGQGLKAVEDGDDTVLFLQRWDRNFEVFHFLALILCYDPSPIALRTSYCLHIH